jgi:hypothetical protein
MELRLSLPTAIEAYGGGGGAALTEFALQPANLVPALSWLAIAYWNYGHHFADHLRTRSAQMTALGLFSVAAFGPAAAGMMMAGSTDWIRMPSWARLAVPRCGEVNFTQGLFAGALAGTVLGAGVVLAANMYGRSYISRGEEKPRAQRREEKPCAQRQEKDERIAELRRKIAEYQAEIERLQSSRPGSCATSHASSRCHSRCSSPCHNRFSRGSRTASSRGTSMSPPRSRSPCKSAGRRPLDTCVEQSVCAAVLDFTVSAEEKEEEFLPGQTTPPGGWRMDAEPLFTGQRTPPEGWCSVGTGLGQFFQMGRDGDDDDDDERRKSQRRIRKWSIESTYGLDSWLLSRRLSDIQSDCISETGSD